jgi:hypothetical protein
VRYYVLFINTGGPTKCRIVAYMIDQEQDFLNMPVELALPPDLRRNVLIDVVIVFVFVFVFE